MSTVDSAPAEQTDVAQDNETVQSTPPVDDAQQTQAPAAVGAESTGAAPEETGPATLDPAQFTNTDDQEAVPTPGEPAAHTDPVPEQPQGPSFVDQVAALGFQGIQDEAEAQRRLVEYTAQQHQQMQQMQAQMQYLMQQQQQPTPSPEPEPTQPEPTEAQPYAHWKPPEFNAKAVERWTERDADGQLTWKPDAPLDIKQNTEGYLAYVSEFRDKFEQNPGTAMEPFMEDFFDRKMEEYQTQWNQQWEQQQSSQYVEETSNRIIEENKEWLYVTDARTGEPMRGVDGGYVLTNEGQGVMSYLQQLAGIPDPQQQFTLALQLYHNDLVMRGMQQPNQAPPEQQPPAPTPEAIAQQRKMEHLQSAGVGAIPSRGASLENPDPNVTPTSQNPNARVEDKIRDQMKAAGMWVS